MKKATMAIALLAALTMAGCSDDDTARRVLRQSGYTSITTTGYKFWGCGRDDMFSTGFVAVSPGGQRVEGVVCSDFFKAATVRIF